MKPQKHQIDTTKISGVDLVRLINARHLKDRNGDAVTLTPGALTHWVKNRCPRNDDGKTYNEHDVLAWLVGERGLTAHKPAGEMDEFDKAKLADIKSKTRQRDQATAAAAQKLIDLQDVREDWNLLLHQFKSGLTTLARILVKEVVGQPEAVVKAKIDDRVNDVLKSFAEGWDGAGEPPKGTP